MNERVTTTGGVRRAWTILVRLVTWSALAAVTVETFSFIAITASNFLVFSIQIIMKIYSIYWILYKIY